MKLIKSNITRSSLKKKRSSSFILIWAEKECHINVKKGMHLTNPPLVIYPPPHPLGHVYPTVDQPNQLTFQQDKEFLVVCPFGRRKIKKMPEKVVSNIKVNNQSIESFSAIVKCNGNEGSFDTNNIEYLTLYFNLI